MDDDLPFYRKRKVQVLFSCLLLMGIYFILIAFSGGFWANFFIIIRDGVLCGGAFIIWFVFFAQFVLPVKGLAERSKLLERILLYYIPEFPASGLVNIHGPAIFIKDGKIIQKTVKSGGQTKEEIKMRGSGVIWLDSASAAVLRTPVKFTRAVGPGIVFTNSKETIAGVVDLHTQRQSLGPGEGEDPFFAKPGDMTEDKFKELQDQMRWSTSGLTRDGIEVVANISVVFKIDADETKREGGTYFGYNAEAVFKAISNEGINPTARQDGPNFHVPWNERPAHIAVDVWREYLRKFTLNQLFETPPATGSKTSDNPTTLQFIIGMINERLKNPEVSVLDDSGHPVGRKTASREYQLIKDSGIKIIKVNIRKVCFAPSIEEQLAQQWATDWLMNARLERDRVEQKRKLASYAGVEDAQKEFALLVSQEITAKPPEHPKEALNMLIQDTLKGIVRKPSLHDRLSTEPQDIADIIQWLRDNA